MTGREYRLMRYIYKFRNHRTQLYSSKFVAEVRELESKGWTIAAMVSPGTEASTTGIYATGVSVSLTQKGFHAMRKHEMLCRMIGEEAGK